MPPPSNHRRLFEEYATLEYLLVGDLRAALDDARDAASHRWLVAVSEAVRDALPRKSEVTRTIVSVAVARNPPEATARALEDLCADQGRLVGTYRELHDGLGDAARFLSESRPFHAPLVNWLDGLSNHNRRLQALLKPFFDGDE